MTNLRFPHFPDLDDMCNAAQDSDACPECSLKAILDLERAELRVEALEGINPDTESEGLDADQ